MYSIRGLHIVFPEVKNKQYLPLCNSLRKFGLSHLHCACKTVDCFVISHSCVSLGKISSDLVYYHSYHHIKEKLLVLHLCSESLFSKTKM